MEGTTALKTKIGEQEKTHENRIRVFSDEATKVLETIRVTIGISKTWLLNTRGRTSEERKFC